VARRAGCTDIEASLEVAERKRDSTIRIYATHLITRAGTGSEAAEAAEGAPADPLRLFGCGSWSKLGDALRQSHRTILTSGDREASIANEGTAIIETY
jgi:hypothetical protein